MAKRGGDPDSATSEWFVNLADNTFLDLEDNGSFTVFGRETSETVDIDADTLSNRGPRPHSAK